MKLVRLLYLLIAAMLIASSCSHTNEQLLRAEQLVETAPDSAMAILNKYSYNKLSDKDKALYGLLYIRIRDKKFLSLEPDSFLNFSIVYYKQKADNELLSICYLFRGRQFFNQLQFEKAMKYYLMALDNQISNAVLKGKLFADIGQIHTQQLDFINARRKFLLSFDNYIQAKQVRQAYNVLIYMGRTYIFEQKYDSARIYYSQALHETNDAYVRGNALQENGIAFFYQQTYDSAKYYLEKSILFPYIKNNLAIRYYYLSEVCFVLKKTIEAQSYALKSIKSDADIRTQRECYRILANCASRLNNENDIAKYMLFYQNCSDSIRKIDSQTKGSYIETMHNTQKEVSKSRSWIWYLVTFILIVVVISIWLYIRKHRKDLFVLKMVEEKQLVQKKESVKEIVERTKEALHKSLKEKRIELTKKIKQNTPEGRREMILQLYDELVHFKNKQHFKNEMDNTLNNLYSKLETGYPKLKTKEKQWACLNMLDIPNEDCMQLLDYNMEAFKKMKQRFAQKIGVDAVANIDAVLEKILYDAT